MLEQRLKKPINNSNTTNGNQASIKSAEALSAKLPLPPQVKSSTSLWNRLINPGTT